MCFLFEIFYAIALEMNKYKPKYDTYDLLINGRKVKRLDGIVSATKFAETQSGGLFGAKHIQLVNIETGELIIDERR